MQVTAMNLPKAVQWQKVRALRRRVSNNPINQHMAQVSQKGSSFVSGWARHIDRAFDLGLWLPAVREQFVNATVHV
jgi:hypothetical protein